MANVYTYRVNTITKGLSGPEIETQTGKRSRYFRYLVDTNILVEAILSGKRQNANKQFIFSSLAKSDQHHLWPPRIFRHCTNNLLSVSLCAWSPSSGCSSSWI